MSPWHWWSPSLSVFSLYAGRDIPSNCLQNHLFYCQLNCFQSLGPDLICRSCPYLTTSLCTSYMRMRVRFSTSSILIKSWQMIQSLTNHIILLFISIIWLCNFTLQLLSAPLRSNGGRLCFATVYYRHPCVATRADYVLLRFIYFIFFFFIQRSFSETTRPILTKFSGIVYSGVVWIIR